MEEISNVTSQPDSDHLATGGMGIGDQDSGYDEVRPEEEPAEATDAERDFANDDSPRETATAEATDLGQAGLGREPELAEASPAADWHDIQAMFVDDPRASVQFAAEKAQAAVSALGEVLRVRRSALDMAAAGTPSTAGETEELRETLRSYRIFCQSLSDVGGQLQDPAAMTR